MIRSVVVPTLASSDDSFYSLSDMLEKMGFCAGEGWDDERSIGAPFLAPLGAVELVKGQKPADCDILIEVSDLERCLEIVREYRVPLVREPYESHWSSRVAIAKLPTGLRIGFFEFLKQPSA